MPPETALPMSHSAGVTIPFDFAGFQHDIHAYRQEHHAEAQEVAYPVAMQWEDLFFTRYREHARFSRDHALVGLLLRGHPLAHVAREHGLSTERCLQILQSVCQKLHPRIYKQLRGDAQECSLTVLRLHRKRFRLKEKTRD